MIVPIAQTTASAAPNLTVTPITWGIVGLDSNNVNVGPNTFAYGARVCNTGTTAATNVVATARVDERPTPTSTSLGRTR